MSTGAKAPPVPSRRDGTRRLGHIPALDGLRGVAVLLVVLDHIQTILVPHKVRIDAGPFRGAFLGVDIFFVLSGFLITSLLLGEQLDRSRIRFGAFYSRRALRLLPALYLLLGAHVVYTAITRQSLSTEWLTVRGALLYVSNWTWKWDGFKSAPGLGQLWSLSIEEQFYLVWPALLLLFFGIRRRTEVVIAVMGVAILAIALHRAVMWHNGTSWFFLLLRTDTRADSLLVGALLAQLWIRGWSPRRGVVAAARVASVLLFVAVVFARSEKVFLYYGGFTLFALGVAVVVYGVADGRWRGARVLEWSPLRAVGRVSYGLYLWHLPVFYAVNRVGSSWGAPARAVVALPLSALFTMASWTLLERPILDWRQRRRLMARSAPEPREQTRAVTRGPNA